MSDKSFDAYNLEQLSEKILPERISSIHFDVEAIEGKKLEKNLETLEISTHSIKEHTDEKFAYVDSMGMYPLLNELKESNEKLDDLAILEQRVSGGKNDIDVAFLPGKMGRVMLEDFGWDSEAISKQRGHLERSETTLDIMEREELEHFPWREVALGNETFFVQNPREAVCEKINAFITDKYDGKEELEPGEVKWGIDIKLLKTYLIASEGITPEELEKSLSEDWESYQFEKRYGSITKLSEKLNKNNTPEEVIKNFVDSPDTNVNKLIKERFPLSSNNDIENVLESDSKESLFKSLKSIVDKNLSEYKNFKEAQSLAFIEYEKLLS